MKLNMVFTIAAVFLILLGLVSLLTPAAAALGTTDLTAGFFDKQTGFIALALGVMAWLLRNAEASKTRDTLALGYTLLFALWSVSCIYGLLLVDMPSHNGLWMPALIHGLLAIGFFVSGRASMAASAS